MIDRNEVRLARAALASFENTIDIIDFCFKTYQQSRSGTWFLSVRETFQSSGGFIHKVFLNETGQTTRYKPLSDLSDETVMAAFQLLPDFIEDYFVYISTVKSIQTKEARRNTGKVFQRALKQVQDNLQAANTL
jgi:hypothetical protein